MVVIKRGVLEARRKELRIVRGLPAQAAAIEFECPVCKHDSRLSVDELVEVPEV